MKYRCLIFLVLSMLSNPSVVMGGQIKANNIDKENTSQKLINESWIALEKNDFEKTHYYADKCIGLYAAKALEQQSQLKEYPWKTMNEIAENWALNDVGVAYFIKGEAYRRNSEWDKAKEAYQMIINKYFYSQVMDCWPWKPAEAAKEKIKEIDRILYFLSPNFYTLTKIIDGKTLILNGDMTVRLQSIKVYKKNQGQLIAFYKEALKSGRIKLEFDEDKFDEQGNALVYLWVKADTSNDPKISKGEYRKLFGGQPYDLLNAMIVSEGYAKPRFKNRDDEYRDWFISLYRHAKKNRRGLWK